MMRYHMLAAAAVAALATTGPARAGFETGATTLQLGASAFYVEGADTGTISGDVSYSAFVNDNVELGVLQSINYTVVDGGDDVWSAGTIGVANYNFAGPDDTFVPFAGAFLGANYNEDDITGTAGPNLGFKSFLNDTTYALVRYRYEFFFSELDSGDIQDSASDGNHVVTVGLGVKF